MTIDFGATEYVRQLMRVGVRPPEPLIRNILKHSNAAFSTLLQMATNVELLHEDEPDCYAPIHALRLLGEVPRVSMIEPLLRTFPIGLLYEDEELPRLWANEAPQMIGRLGAEAVEPLWAIVDDPSWVVQARGTAVVALCCVTVSEPETRDALVTELRRRLSENADADVKSHLVVGLASLGVSDAYSEIMALYRGGTLGKEIMPASVARKMLLGGGETGLKCTAHPLGERYDHHGPFESEREA